MPLTFEDAKKQVNPSLDDEQKDGNGLTAADRSALALVAGTAANDAYWDSRTRIEQLEARATGHGVVVRGADEGESAPAVASGTETEPVIDSTATEELATGAATEPGSSVAAAPPAPAPDNPTEAVATLRRQLEDAGLNPQA